MEPPHLIRPRELDTIDLDWTGRWRGVDIWRMLAAARDGEAATLRAALQADATLADAEFWYMTPLHFAVREGHLDAVRVLVEAGADLTYRNALYGNDTLLQMALDRGYEEVAAYLREQLRARAASSGSRHPIHDAIEAGDTELVRERLAAEASAANIGDHLGRGPLHYAVHAGGADLVDLLLEHGADIDALGFSADDRIGVDGFRPVAVALWHHPLRQRNDYAMARHLLERGARYSITIAAALGDAARVAELLRGDPAAADEAEPSASGRYPRRPNAGIGRSCECCSMPAPTPTFRRAGSARTATRSGRPRARGTARSPSCCWNPAPTQTPMSSPPGTRPSPFGRRDACAAVPLRWTYAPLLALPSGQRRHDRGATRRESGAVRRARRRAGVHPLRVGRP